MNPAAPSVYDRWLVHQEGERRKRNGRLYVSDVGKCPRRIGYDLLDTTAKPSDPVQHNNMLRKFRLGVLVEQEMLEALRWSGQLVDYHVHLDLRDNWGGELDFLVKDYPDEGDGLRVFEMKGEFTKAYRFLAKEPRLEHTYQVGIYDDEMGGLPLPPLVHYERLPDTKFSKGSGEDLWCEYIIDPKPDTAPLMDELDAMRSGLPELPGILPRVLKFTNKKRGSDQYTKVSLVPDWRCNYCPYSNPEEGGVCACETSVETWAEWDGGWSQTKRADSGVLAGWAEGQADEALKALL